MSWDTSTAATTRPSNIDQAVWSPCNKFIAITWANAGTVDILDPVTLQQLQTLKTRPASGRVLIFSPDSHILTSSGYPLDCQEVLVVSWDLQTGGTISTIRHQFQELTPNPTCLFPFSVTYSANGKMVGILQCWGYEGGSTFKILIFDIFSGVHMHSHVFDSNYVCLGDIWTQGESLSFATFFDKTTTIIWEVRFTLDATPVEVGRHSPQIHNVDNLLYIKPIPVTPSQVLLILSHGFLVWDSQTSKPLLDCTDTGFHPTISFSSDGHFLAHSTKRSGIYLWKDSPTGYILQDTLASYIAHSNLLLSPNGESIIAFGSRTICLWQTKSFTTTPSRILAQGLQDTQDFLLDFSPDGNLAVVARISENDQEKQDPKYNNPENNTVMVLNPNSGIPWLTIDVGMKVYGLHVTRNTVLVVDSSKVIAWNLPAGDCNPNIRMGVEDSSWTTNLDDSPPGKGNYVHGASISPDSCHIAIITGTNNTPMHSDPLLSVYSALTGVCLMYTSTFFGGTPWFTPDGHNIWSVGETVQEKYALGAGHGLRWVHGSFNRHPPKGSLWESSHGYQVTDDWWVLDPDGKQLLMLPPPWRSYLVHRVWKGQFLVLLHGTLLEPVILDLQVTQ